MLIHMFEDQIWPIHFEKGLQDPDTFEKKIYLH